MSQSYQKLVPVLVEDPITSVADISHSYAILSGGNQVSYNAVTSTSISPSSVNFTAPPPSGNIITDRYVLLQLPIRLNMAGNIATNNSSYTPSTSLINAGFDAPRFLPISGSMNTLSARINNDTITVPLYKYIHALTRYNIGTELQRKDYSITPIYPDQSMNYSDLIGSNLNPLGQYANQIQGTAIPRGGYPFTIVTGTNVAVTPSTGAGTAASASVDFVATEPLIMSPFYFGCQCNDVQGFYNLNAMDFTFSFLTQAAWRMWSHCPLVSTSGTAQVTSNITSMTYQFNNFSPAFSYTQNVPLLMFKYITPNLLTKQPLNPNLPITYPYYEPNPFQTQVGTQTYAQGSVKITANNLQLTTIPQFILVYIRPDDNTLTTRCDITDSYLTINQIAIRWTNQNTVLSTATQPQLYETNVRNGSNQNWVDWSGLPINNSALPPNTLASTYHGCSGPIALYFGRDIQLNANEAPGVNGQFMLTVEVYASNNNSNGAWDNIPFVMTVLTISEGSFTIPSLGNAIHQVGVITQNDVLDAQDRPGVTFKSVQTNMEGGDFFGTLMDFGRKIHDFIKQNKVFSNVAKSIPTAVPYAGPIARLAEPVLEHLGYGRGGKRIGGCGQGAGVIQRVGSGGVRMRRSDMPDDIY